MSRLSLLGRALGGRHTSWISGCSRRRSVRVALILAIAPALGSAATIPVSTVLDDLVDNGNCTLREAILAAETNANEEIDACPTGSAVEDDIVLLPAAEHRIELGEIRVSGANSGSLIVRGAPFAPGLSPPTQIRGSSTTPSRLFLILGGSDVSFERLTLRGGLSTGAPGGAIRAENANLAVIDCLLTNNRTQGANGGAISYDGFLAGTLRVERVLFRFNRASGPGFARGGALEVVLTTAERSARIVDSDFQENSVATTSAGGVALGGAVFVLPAKGASVELLRAEFVANEIEVDGAGSQPQGSAIFIEAQDAGSRVRVTDSSFVDHRILMMVPPAAGSTGTLSAFALTGSRISLDRLFLEHNDVDQPGEHLVVRATQTGTSGSGEIELTNLLIADGPDTGLLATCGDGSCLLGNITLVSHVVRAARLRRDGMAPLRLENSILFASGPVLLENGAVVDPSTLVGVDPEFVSEPGVPPYVPGPSSPALDFGDASLPSVRGLDARHGTRVVGAQIDAGAYERGALFGDAFESGDAGAWSAVLR